jgi:hypothetical protein
VRLGVLWDDPTACGNDLCRNGYGVGTLCMLSMEYVGCERYGQDMFDTMLVGATGPDLTMRGSLAGAC